MSSTGKFRIILFVALFVRGSVQAGEVSPVPDLRQYVPDTVSSGWKEVFANFPDPEKALPMPAPDDKAAWKRLHEMVETETIPRQQQLARSLGVRVEEKRLGGVPVLWITPARLADSRKLIVYTHGGAYTMLSARSTLGGASLLADATGLPVVSIDYTNPPEARWPEVTDQVIAVLQALQEQGHVMGEIALAGDSAGGALVAGATLKLRDRHLPLPAALVLWSPWADITPTGDTYVTLRDAEPRFIYERVLKPSADAYADPVDQKNPYVSPVYGDYSRGFPPTLIQGGTREIFLSNFVRLYQALDTAGQTVKLDLYEGMPHVFQATLPDSPETGIALRKLRLFLQHHLHYGDSVP